MTLGLTVNQIRGLDGRIEIVGLGAVVALIQRWNLERHPEDGPAGPVWTLGASFSYQNDQLLKLNQKRRITLLVNDKITFYAESLDGSEWKVEGNSLRIEGVRVWQK